MTNHLKDRRIQLHLTQKEVAEAVGVTEGTISRYESGDIANMKRDKIRLYAKVLGTSTNFIMTGEFEAADDHDDLDAQLLRAFWSAETYIQDSILGLLQLPPLDRQNE